MIFFVQSLMKEKKWNYNSLLAAKMVQFCQIKLRNIDNELFTCKWMIRPQ